MEPSLNDSCHRDWKASAYKVTWTNTNILVTLQLQVYGIQNYYTLIPPLHDIKPEILRKAKLLQIWTKLQETTCTAIKHSMLIVYLYTKSQYLCTSTFTAKRRSLYPCWSYLNCRWVASCHSHNEVLFLPYTWAWMHVGNVYGVFKLNM